MAHSKFITCPHGVVNTSLFFFPGCTSEWQSAIDIFVVNAANLMRATKDTLSALKLAYEIPNNVFSAIPPVEVQPVASSATFQQYPLSLGVGEATLPQPYTPKLGNASSTCEPRSLPLSLDTGNTAFTSQPGPLPPRPAISNPTIPPQPVPPSLGVAPSAHFSSVTFMCATSRASSETLQSVPHDIRYSGAAIVQQQQICASSAQPQSTIVGVKATGMYMWCICVYVCYHTNILSLLAV